MLVDGDDIITRDNKIKQRDKATYDLNFKSGYT